MKRLLYISAFLCAAAACTKSGLPAGGGYPADGVVRISPTVAAPVTRAEGSTEYGGSRLGLGLYYGENDKYNRPSSLWRKDKDGNWTTSGAQVLWKDAETEVAVYAFVPYEESDNSDFYTNRAFNVSVPTDQSDGLDAADALWYLEKVKPEEALDQDGKLHIELKHALLKMTVNLTYGNEFGDEKPSVKEVWLNGTWGDVICSLSEEGRLFAIGFSSVDIRMRKVSENCYEAIFYPSTGQKAGGDALTVVFADGKDYHMTLSEDLNFVKDSNGGYLGGCAYSMTVQVGKNKIQLENVDITPWQESPSSNLEAEEKN